MLKNINKSSSKIALIFTVLYILIGQFMLSDYLSGAFLSGDWIPKFVYRHLPLHHILLLPTYLYWVSIVFYNGYILVAIIFGIRAIIETYKAQEKIKCVLLFSLTLFNTFVLVFSIGVAFFPQTFL
ncbi:MAG: hypothetical protein A2860_01210 [Candidatus Levybacteria bacterium RIFCSPHIGHO2_01_FULL_37_33]|uniref:Uncharacterized protein n=1 Tax=Candidatus Zambryskibacteria bacterium RIFCSPHIGHO2_12_FULL_38_37 TaxID=1802751 RepID=A0A1G2TKM1_9BACT|nr:MAG: hypothetical protein A2860_01210 [Candidatus Levybacteria bacterium RIFCSPHIGHO2_01_FULL_37_33]OHA97743.1 MAG: hypothetical protein A3E32_01030 [Candidatus Zambryskibacteria bacterium RIFCSPHIGHO2_12_FULL_38_37]OHB14219.1 MAG: hypothetical protein A3G47_02465 [Candidatus Zambryskibacteria bacterium RIFCSPLOWO2_12_FULL_39_45]